MWCSRDGSKGLATISRDSVRKKAKGLTLVALLLAGFGIAAGSVWLRG
jgi:hypothetical protein